MKTNEIIGLIDQFGMQTTLGEVLKKIQGNRIYRCPKCQGRGFISIEYNAYPKGLPDSGSVYEAGYRNEPCDLCNGDGWTAHEYKPKMIQDGWEWHKAYLLRWRNE